MAIVTMKALLESGVHFGHRTNKWHPAMKPYIFTERNNIHIIDLQQKAIRCGMPYVIYRWLGGTLTNWRTIRERLNELERLERMRDSGEFEQFTKKEALNFNRKIERLDMLLGGVRTMSSLPDLLFVVDVRREETSIHEANLLDIPVIAMVDTNCNPKNVDYIIPSNDDAIRAIKLLVNKMADAVLEGKASRKEEEEIEDALRMEMAEIIEEEEIPDEDLLGEATLAKITASVQQKQEIPEEAEAEVEAEEIAEVIEAEMEEGDQEEAAIEGEIEEIEPEEAAAEELVEEEEQVEAAVEEEELEEADAEEEIEEEEQVEASAEEEIEEQELEGAAAEETIDELVETEEEAAAPTDAATEVEDEAEETVAEEVDAVDIAEDVVEQEESGEEIEEIDTDDDDSGKDEQPADEEE
jgi:small subunit ribosomal protein S2